MVSVLWQYQGMFPLSQWTSATAVGILSIPVPQHVVSASQLKEVTEQVNSADLFQCNFYLCSAAWWGIYASYLLSWIVTIYSNLAF